VIHGAIGQAAAHGEPCLSAADNESVNASHVWPCVECAEAKAAVTRACTAQ
jgi:hypothetical protein